MATRDGDASAPETPLLRPLLRHSETMKGYADYGDELTNPAHFQWRSQPVDAVEEWEEDVEDAADEGGPPRLPSATHRHAPPPPPPPEHPNSFTDTVLNLSKVILGSGMLVSGGGVVGGVMAPQEMPFGSTRSRAVHNKRVLPYV